MTKPKRWQVRVVLVCYGAALLFYLAVCGLQLLADQLHTQNGQLQKRDLPFDSFYAEGVVLNENPEGGTDLVSSDPDPRLVYSPGEPFYVSRFTFAAETSNKPGGEMVLYYTTRPGEDFSEQKKLSAQRGEDGNWFFDLGGKKVTALRFDPDTTGGVLWRNWSITLNDEKPVIDYFLPDARVIFVLLFVPTFLLAVLMEGAWLRREYLSARKGKDRLGKNTE